MQYLWTGNGDVVRQDIPYFLYKEGGHRGCSPHILMAKIIFTDNPQREIWSLLGLFESKKFVSDKLKERFPSLSEEALQTRTDGVTYSVKQAREFFSSSDQVSLLTRPLLLSYGMLNLGKALVFYKSPEDTIFESYFKSHGLNFATCASDQSLANEHVEIKRSGTYLEISHFFSQQAYPNKRISIKDLLSQIPDLSDMFIFVYKEGPDVMPLKKSKLGYSVGCSTEHSIQYEEKMKGIGQYLKENKVKRQTFMSEHGNSIHLMPPIGKTLVELDLSLRSISGVEYFRIFPMINLEPLILREASIHYMLIFSYGMLARYQAARWGKYIDPNFSNEAEIINKSIFICKIKYLQLLVCYLFETEFRFMDSIEMTENDIDDKISELLQRKLPDEIRKYL